MQERAYQIDLGRQVETPEFVMQHIPSHAAWGYGTLMLYLEDAFRFPSHPEFAQSRAWTPKQLAAVCACASKVGMRVLPVVPALGHTAYFIKHPKYRYLSENHEKIGEDGLPLLAGQVCPSLEETYTFLTDLFRDMAPYCTAGVLHVSLDESFDLGVCSRCRRRTARHGQGRLFLEHLQRLHSIITGLGLRMAVWGDMFYYFPEIIPDIPRDVAVYDWYYYPFRRFPRVELHNFRDVDSAGLLRRAGLEVWGCPNNGPFFCEIAPPFTDRLRNIQSWWNYGARAGCQGMAVTSWAPNYAPVELNCVVDAAAADLWLERRPPPAATMLRHGLERVYGAGGAKLLPALDLLDRHQLVGYWRYQTIRSPIGKTATLEAPASLPRSAAAFAAQRARLRRLKAPTAILGTVRVREYYLAKERLSREGSSLLLAIRRAAASSSPRRTASPLASLNRLLADTRERCDDAIVAARGLWKLSRYEGQKNALVEALNNDCQSLDRLGKFLRRVAVKPAVAFESCELLGSRQILVKVRNRRPCLQGLQIQVSTDGREFRPIHTLYLLEFSADAGQPRTHFVHWHTAAVPDDLAAGTGALYVRFKATGIGEVEISLPSLVCGAKRRPPSRALASVGRVSGAARLLRGGWTVIGNRAPTAGLPLPSEFARDNGVTVEFGPPH